MSFDDRNQIAGLYAAALARPAAERASFLDDVCANRAELRREIDLLIASTDSPTGIPNTPGVTAPQRDAVRELAGRRLGTYTIGSRIGHGGMGEVYRAHDEKLDRDVAIKILPWIWLGNPDRRARFDREARLLAALNHPHIAAIYGVAEADDVRGLVLELVEGSTLADHIATGALPIREAVRIARQIADALEAAHESGIIHRDLKPSNIKITPAGVVKVLDFGLAKEVPLSGAADMRQPSSVDGQTGEGVLLGTPSYMSPEHARGFTVDKRADIWAFGCVLYEMLTGRVAFAGIAGDTPFDTLAAVLGRDPDWKALPKKTPVALQRLLERCLEKDATKRLRDIGEARIELERLHAPRAPISRQAILFAAIPAIGAIAVAVWLWAGQEPANTRLTGDPRQLTFAPGLEAEPMLSPDGSLVAYTSNEAGNADIWIIDARGGNPLRLTTDQASDHRPAWFPDGSAIAFVSTRSGRNDIWKVPRLGGPAMLLVADASDPAISPDGSQVAFSRPGPSTLQRIAVAPIADTSRARFLTGDEDGLWNHQTPSWSPDGKTICYAAQNALWLVRADGGKPWALTTDHQFDQEPVWSNDGRYLYFASLREGTAALWRVDANGGRPERVTMGTGPERQPSTSRDGARLAYSTFAASSDIVLIDLHSGKTQKLPSVRDETKPSFAPDQRAVAFASNRWDGRYDLWLQPLRNGVTEGGPQRITDHPDSATYPAYSPDGQWIAYGRVLGEHRDIWLISASGGMPIRITTGNGAHFHPSWSPDGSRIAFVSEEGGVYRIQIMGVAGGRSTGETTTVASMPTIPFSPVWSDTGSELAYINDTEIWMIDVGGRGVPRLVTSGAGAQRVRWNRRSGHLFASGLWGTNYVTVRVVNPVTGAPRELPFPIVLGQTLNYVDFDVSSDESIIAIDQEDLKGDIWVVDSKPRSY